MIKRIYKILFVFVTILVTCEVFSQEDLKKEVLVVKPYEPTIIDANKINELPLIDDSIKVNPTFSYEIFPRQITTEFETEPLKPAKMVGEPLNALYGKYIRAGFGNYWTPYLAAGIHNLRSKDYSYGAIYNHISSAGKIKLKNNQKSYAGYFDEKLLLYGKKFLPNAFFSSELGVNGTGRHYYGYNTEIDTSLNKKDLRKRFFDVEFNSRLKSNFTDSLHLNYDALFNYYYFSDNFKNYENSFFIKTHLDKFFGTEKFGGDAVLNYLDRNPALDSSNAFLFKAAPWIGKFGSRWQVKVGLNLALYYAGDKAELYYYPVASLEYNIINNYVVPYAGLDGDFELNTLRNIANENCFYSPTIAIEPTNKKMILYGGVKGNISSISSFNIRGTYAIIDNYYFYVNDESLRLDNYFIFERDNLEYKNLFAEFETKPNEKLLLGVKGNFHGYKLYDVKHAWHKPKYDVTFIWGYNFQNKILFNANVFVIGEKYVKNIELKPEGYDILETVIDLNLDITYIYSEQITGFIKLNNLAGSSYYIWNYYPSQKFNFIAGLSYSF
ncbi:MAG: hypothetical protein JXB17_08715 [Bacteroidales bacterium]|nr:hypothetical protein [Bacteroidales bacterium]